MVLIGSFFLPYRMYNAAAKRILKPPESTQFTHIHNFSRNIPKSTDSIKMAMSEASLLVRRTIAMSRRSWSFSAWKEVPSVARCRCNALTDMCRRCAVKRP